MDDDFQKEFIERVRYGAGGKAGYERNQQLIHEEKLALIRTQSHALVWTGPADELRTIISRWYEAGWIISDSIEQALQKASIHFVKPDGSPVLKPAEIALQSVASSKFKSLDESYQVIEFDGRQYELTPTQSTIIRVLHASHVEKKGSVGIKEIQKALQVNSGKMSGWFRRKNKDLYDTLIVQTSTRQHYRLDL
jgi:hypothetical protein